MNILLIGNGGREHALALAILKSKSLDKLYIAPGNPGTKTPGENVSLNIEEHQEVLNFCLNNSIDFVLVGPEKPLVDGIADFLRNGGIPVFGSGKLAARIEGDKSFAKQLMKKYNIPTAAFEIFYKNDYEKAVRHLNTTSYPTVIKASGLAAGKGVLICSDKTEALEAINSCFNENIFGEAGNVVVIEEFMEGEEASLFAITDGKDFISLPVAQDHKRIGNGDTGKNTGGMGAYAPAPVVTDNLKNEVERTIIKPIIDAMRIEGFPFNGCLFCGLMMTKEGPKVVEFNCRFGDPETQVVLPLLEGDTAELFYSVAKENIKKDAVKYNGGSALCIIAASEGYPDNYKKGFEITGLETELSNVIVYHAGTVEKDDKIVTAGGRVLGVCGLSSSNDLNECYDNAYKAIESIKFENIYYRNDIGHRAIRK